MDILLYPRVAPADRLRVWIGVFDVTAPPLITWIIDDSPAAPIALRELSSVRPDNLLPTDTAPENMPRAFAGVYEFSGLTPDTLYRIQVTVDNESKMLETRTLPDVVPSQLDRTFNVLLVSCFHQAEDRGGLASTIVSQLKATSLPHMTLLAGDQVYLDLPTLKDFPDNATWLAAKFEQDYTMNWRGPLGYTGVLSAAPGVSIPDDHEYWNNYPHVSPFIQNSFKEESRTRWRSAAQAVYEGFQLPYPAKLGEPTIVEVEPLSFFVADTRSNKDFNRRFTMTDEVHQQLDDWVSQVIERQQFGVFISGQSLLSPAAGELSGGIGDFELANYGDYNQIMASLQRLADAGRPVLLLTGDVHWGRVVTSIDIHTGRIAFSEVISSPASLVTTIGHDQARRVGAFFGGLFGSTNPWPRHSEPANPPTFLASDVFGGRFPCSKIHGQKGNHVVLLMFRQNGGGLELRIKYWPISLDQNVGRPEEVGPIDLSVA
ncbi:MAG TPA: hypothetical protein VKN18_09870 [Blastocatellia bacterium]|nr:hypothetical protein [Blastocatellia bacterium]